MRINNSIKYLNNRDIDNSRWDKLIDTSANGLIYAYSYYLDSMAKNWDALVLNDYEAVMPLPWNKKHTIHYLYQPFLTAQLGIFGNKIDAILIENFLKAIPKKFRYIDLFFNQQNVSIIKEFEFTLRSNFILDLNKPYNEIFTNYRENVKRNIKKSLQAGCISQKGIDPEDIISLALQQMKTRPEETNKNIKCFRKLYKLLDKKGMAATYGILNNKNELVSSAVFFYSHNRAYYILVGNHPNGKTIGASHALIDAFIKDHAGKPLVLDFEGSDIRNLAFFYSSFGAIEEKYPALKLNRLPTLLKWLKN
jgi:hypothetical protein